MIEKSPLEEQKKQYRYQKSIVVAYACVLAVMLCMVVYTGVVRGVLGMGKEDSATGTAAIDWEERYPFTQTPDDDQVPETQELDAQGEGKNIVARLAEQYQSRMQGIKATLEWYCTDGFLLQPQCIELSAYVNRITQTKIIRSANTLVNVHGGYITMLAAQVDTKEYADNVIAFMEFLEAEGIDGLYVESLFKVDREDENPLLYDDYTNRNADELIGYLQEAGVPVLDLRALVFEQGLSHYELFFKTDTHWLPSTGLWATAEISRELNERFSCNIVEKVLELSRWEQEEYKDAFLGSNGRNVGLAYSTPEDFDVILPKFETNIRYVSEALDIDVCGNYADTLIDWSKVENANYYDNSCYEAYMYGRQPLAHIYNQNNENENRILFVSDSFGITVAPFLALGVAQVDFIDPRLFNGSIEAYVKETEPDVVVMMFNPEVITNISPNSNDSCYMLK